jgi:hypothetical protein
MEFAASNAPNRGIIAAKSGARENKVQRAGYPAALAYFKSCSSE